MRSARRQRGTVFIVTLSALTCLVAVVAAVAASNRETVHAAENRIQASRAQLAAESAIQRAISEIQTQDAAHATLQDSWATLGDAGATEFEVGSGKFRLQVIDACSLVNLNTAPEAQLKNLPFTEDQVASVLDWRETGTSPRTLGAKDEYYNALKNPYNAKLNPFDSLQELLLVKGFTPQSLYPTDQTTAAVGLADLLTLDSVSADRDPSGNQKFDANSATPNQYVQIGVPLGLAYAIIAARTGNYTGLIDVLSVPGMTTQAAQAIADYVMNGTATQQTGLININTATASVLQTVPGITSDLADQIVNYQTTVFQNLGDLLNLPGMTLPTFAAVVDHLCVSSRSFKVRVIGEAGRSRVSLEANLLLGDTGQVTITRLEPYPLPDSWKRWSWPEAPTRQEVIQGVSQ